MDQQSECIFCQIVRGSAPATPIAENEAALAFMDIHPANDGHCLVIPKAHHATIFEIPPEVFASVAHLTVRVAVAVQTALRPAGLNLVQANGEAANQTVFHLHVHILPRRSDDALSLNWPRTAQGAPARITELAERIRKCLPQT